MLDRGLFAVAGIAGGRFPDHILCDPHGTA